MIRITKNKYLSLFFQFHIININKVHLNNKIDYN